MPAGGAAANEAAEAVRRHGFTPLTAALVMSASDPLQTLAARASCKNAAATFPFESRFDVV
jgi:hypothetical protein